MSAIEGKGKSDDFSAAEKLSTMQNKVPPDAINLLIEDHREATKYFQWYFDAAPLSLKRKIAGRLCLVLWIHMQIEEELFYPAAKQAIEEQDLIQHSFKEHAEARDIIEKILALPEDEDMELDMQMEKLQKAVDHHVEEEEASLFPKIREEDMQLYELGAKLAAYKTELLHSQRMRLCFERGWSVKQKA